MPKAVAALTHSYLLILFDGLEENNLKFVFNLKLKKNKQQYFILFYRFSFIFHIIEISHKIEFYQ